MNLVIGVLNTSVFLTLVIFTEYQVCIKLNLEMSLLMLIVTVFSDRVFSHQRQRGTLLVHDSMRVLVGRVLLMILCAYEAVT